MIFSPVEEINITPSVGDVGYSTTTFVDEVGDYLGCISNLWTIRRLVLPTKDGIHVSYGGVELRCLVGVAGDVVIKLHILLTNLPLESCSLYMHYKLF